MKPQEVTQFIIVPPANKLAEMVKCRDHLSDWLAKRYPRYTFEVAGLAPIQDDDCFIAIPVMSYRSPDGDMLMCKEPDRWLVNDIMASCATFDPDSLSRFAA